MSIVYTQCISATHDSKLHFQLENLSFDSRHDSVTQQLQQHTTEGYAPNTPSITFFCESKQRMTHSISIYLHSEVDVTSLKRENSSTSKRRMKNNNHHHHHHWHGICIVLRSYRNDRKEILIGLFHCTFHFTEREISGKGEPLYLVANHCESIQSINACNGIPRPSRTLWQICHSP